MFTPLPKPFTEIELHEPVDLCLPNGRLNRKAVGWSRVPLQHCNLSGSWLRKKRWNYWCVTSDTLLFSATIANIDYAGMAFIYFYDTASNTFVEQTVLTPFGGGCIMPPHVNTSVHFRHRALAVNLEQSHTAVEIRVSSDHFAGAALEARFTVTYPPQHETLNVVVPWNDAQFQFTGKHNTLPTSGDVRWGEHTYAFADDRTFACLDFGRGIWPAASTWNWGSASGRCGDTIVGLNLGGKWTDGTGSTENALCVDGRLTKIGEDLTWDYDRTRWMRPWRIRTPVTDRIDLTFTPTYDRAAGSNALIVHSSVHQMFGHYNGTVRTDDGVIVEVKNLFGWAEDHVARW